MRIVAVERLKRLELGLGSRISHPLDRLPRRDEPYIVHGSDCVQEQLKTLLVVWRCEPCRMVKETKWSSVGLVMALKVFQDHHVDALSVRRITAGISHGTSSVPVVVPHHQRQLPEAGERLSGTGRDHAVMEDLVVEGVRKGRRLVFIDWHGRVVGEVGIV